jgi:ElaB/YqjD/DUF883 family membrane-anchored ribosome-binding protein
MTTPSSNDDFKSQFSRLGKNLEELVRSAWDSPERQNIQNQLEEGFNEVFQSLSQAASDFRASDTGRQLEQDLESLRRQIASGEVTEKMREEILSALQQVNSQLEQAVSHWGSRHPTGQTPPPPDSSEEENVNTA